MSAFFITATGTEIGKTYITTSLCHYFLKQELPVFAIKPIITGWNEAKEASLDTVQIAKSLHLPTSISSLKQISPWRFSLPLSPHLAADYENHPIDLEAVIHFCRETLNHPQKRTVFMEGAGGIMTPVNWNSTFLDIIQQLHLPTILVVGSYLGTLSHSLTAIEVLRYHHLPLHSIIISESEQTGGELTDIQHSLSKFAKAPVFIAPRNTQCLYWESIPEALLTSLL